MSWSNVWIGRVDAVVRAIDVFSDTLQGVSKVEFDDVKGPLKTLVMANSGDEFAVKLEASGHAYDDPKSGRVSACTVELKKFGMLVE